VSKVFRDLAAAMAALRPKKKRKLPAVLDIVGRQPPSREALAIAREARRAGLVKKR
jgi:hypothetical protein